MVDQAEPNAPMGRKGCDPPKVTFDSMIKLLKKCLKQKKRNGEKKQSNK